MMKAAGFTTRQMKRMQLMASLTDEDFEAAARTKPAEAIDKTLTANPPPRPQALVIRIAVSRPPPEPSRRACRRAAPLSAGTQRRGRYLLWLNDAEANRLAALRRYREVGPATRSFGWRRSRPKSSF